LLEYFSFKDFLRRLTLQKKNIQQSFSFCEIFLRWLTVAKKKNSLIEKALVSLLEKSVWLAGCPRGIHNSKENSGSPARKSTWLIGCHMCVHRRQKEKFINRKTSGQPARNSMRLIVCPKC
jgi:hypothetical protein